MLRILANLPSRFLRRSVRYCFSGKDEKLNLVPSVVDSSKTFFRHVYGMELEKHILPHNSYNFNWKLDDMKEYRKKIPNYVVILVNKVLDEAEHIQEGIHPPEIKNKYYPICTYCKVKYHKNYTQIEGLYRVRLTNINEVKEEPIAEGEKKVEILETHEPDNDMEDEGVLDEGGELTEAENTAPTLIAKRPSKKITLNLFSVQVDLLEQPPLTLNHRLEIKLKYLIESYKSFFPSYNRYKFLLFNPNEALKNIYLIAQQMSNENFKPKEIQTVLEANDPEMKMDLIQNLMNKTLDWKMIYRHLEKSAESNLKNKKFYEYYSEILKIAKQSIDGKKGKQLFIERITKQFLEKKPSKEIKEVFDQQRDKFLQMDETSVEATVIKKYLEDLSRIPYSIKSTEIYDLDFAEKALDQEHYGMKQVKDAILEIIAVGQLKGSLKGKIFCLVGGPGLGKTTIAKSIAKALGRKFYNISLGGVTDSSVLKGHRRTYVAAYAGKIVEALKHCQTNNPVILLDQIDKMGSGSQGDPRSQLLEILDPNQNSSFVDNYIDLPIDLSNVLFVCSANYERNISKPLLDRMEKIRLNSYTDDQKKQIFKRHLLRRAIEKTGVAADQFELAPDVLEALIHEYSLGQPGVRRLEKNIEKILERAAYRIVEKEEELPIKVNKANLHDYLGNSYFNQKDHDKIGVGVAISLSGGDYGSRLTYIESFKKSFGSKNNPRRGVMFTGSLGDVFKEAMNISYTFARNFLSSELDNRFLFQNEVHIHAPDGASKKDGSTDSLTICTSLVSLALQKQVRKGIAMTGELTLHGRILRTHGIKEKILLARREKIWDVIIPAENEADVEMLNESIKQGFRFHYVRDFKQVYELLFVPVAAAPEHPISIPASTSRAEAVL